MGDQMTGVKYETVCDTCDSCQNICEVGSQYVRNYTPVPNWPCVEKDEVIGHAGDGDNYWNRDNWIDLLEYIDNARFYLSRGYYASSTPLKPLHSSEEFLTAEAFNNAAKALNSGQIIKGSDTENKNPSVQVKKDDLVKGSYLSQLLQDAENLKFGTFQCNDCITASEKETHQEEKPAPCGNCCDCKEKSDKG